MFVIFLAGLAEGKNGGGAGAGAGGGGGVWKKRTT